MKFAVGGKEQHKKDLGMIAMMSGAYVAQVALGADYAQAIRAFREAESFQGPSIILAYSPCISHGFDLAKGPEHQQMLVKTGAWPLYRFNPVLVTNGKNPLIIDSGKEHDVELSDFVASEGRFAIARKFNPAHFDELVRRAESDNEYRRELKKHIAQFALLRNSPKANEG
jgi:pyruvate-ferredoxin/flavodoxin oxidoreductase